MCRLRKSGTYIFHSDLSSCNLGHAVVPILERNSGIALIGGSHQIIKCVDAFSIFD